MSTRSPENTHHDYSIHPMAFYKLKYFIKRALKGAEIKVKGLFKWSNKSRGRRKQTKSARKTAENISRRTE